MNVKSCMHPHIQPHGNCIYINSLLLVIIYINATVEANQYSSNVYPDPK